MRSGSDGPRLAAVSAPHGDLPRLLERDDGLLLAVRVVPGSRADRVIGLHGEALRVAVSAVAERGRANEALVGVLAEAFGLRRRDVQVVAGATRRDKTLLLRGIPLRLARQRLAALRIGPCLKGAAGR